jgi:hypothetical protein
MPFVLRALKWCSTVIYWLTEEAALDLAAAYEFEDLPNFDKRDVIFKPNVPSKVYNVPKIKKDNFHAAATPADPRGRRCVAQQSPL